MDKQSFINRVRSLYNIDADRLPELREQDWPEFRDNPPRYFIHADKAQSDAIFREVEHRQTWKGEAEKVADAAPELLAALKAAMKQLEHDVPSNCWATGPNTGNPIEDLIVCPGCRVLAAAHAAIAKATGARS